jgi:DnaJ-class molecular chaperone
MFVQCLSRQQTSGGEQDYIPEQVGNCAYDSLKILGLGLGALEREVKLAYKRLASLYHPDKWEHTRATTGMRLKETTAHFQLLNNAQAFLWANL